ncbi:hypothetical protein Bhyg_12791 [Pseudolycoriella hygida]|uniref:DUF7726 domain-containing protein n=1 Tax=Pseudolycoriella hygida TaxID=35572 RepID=A0A9Q0MY05_9DIPT|nr:hypothetical protein Bhyg_12791 [Pseudolycoriella hygida]
MSTSDHSSSHDKHHIYRILGLERTTDAEKVERCRDPPKQDVFYNNCPNVHQPQRQFAAPNNFLNAYERENQTVVPYKNPIVYQPIGQIAAPGRQSLHYLKQLYGPVLEDCDEIRRKIRECTYTEMSKRGFARVINVHPISLRRFLGQKGFNKGADNKVYPAAYYYFEIMRLSHREEKSEHRLLSEKHYPNGYEPTKRFRPERRKF